MIIIVLVLLILSDTRNLVRERKKYLKMASVDSLSQSATGGSGTTPPATIVKQGWLYKRGEHIKNWRSRYFILRNDGTLVGYKNHPESSAQAEVTF